VPVKQRGGRDDANVVFGLVGSGGGGMHGGGWERHPAIIAGPARDKKATAKVQKVSSV
jgi:hypothetical protein